jgi:fructan beta-fructosidase
MSLVAGDHLQLFRSSNLIDWELSSTFGQGIGAHGGVWECPDLFELELNGEKHWVLLISINPGGPNGGSATQYFIGDFDGYTFSTDQEDIRWVDHGPDNYAGVTYNDVPDDSRMFIGWMSNWAYAQQTPTEAWRSSMTLPRKLSLFEATDGVRLQSQILDAANSLKEESPSVETLASGQSLIPFEGASQSRIHIETAAEAFSFALQNDTERVVFSINRADGEIVVDCSKSGNVSFSEAFTSEELTADISYINDESLSFEIYVDASSIELLVAGGKTLMTLQVFPDQGYNQIAVDNPTNEAIRLEKERLKGIW